MMKNGKLLVAPALLWLSIFFVIPLLIVVAVSFAGRTPYGQVIFSFTIDNYLRFLEPLYLKIFADTLVASASAPCVISFSARAAFNFRFFGIDTLLSCRVGICFILWTYSSIYYSKCQVYITKSFYEQTKSTPAVFSRGALRL